MLISRILAYGQPFIILCDARCNKAWGRDLRSKVVRSNAEDDWEYMADVELGEAPERTGNTEGDDDKPRDKKHNRWCFRQCERPVKRYANLVLFETLEVDLDTLSRGRRPNRKR